jgi:hypothetical protein
VNHRIDVAAGEDGKSACTYRGERIGEWSDPEREAAHWLLDNSASPDDSMTTYRSGRPCMSARLWSLADRRRLGEPLTGASTLEPAQRYEAAARLQCRKG